jgi:hypothetical protein
MRVHRCLSADPHTRHGSSFSLTVIWGAYSTQLLRYLKRQLAIKPAMATSSGVGLLSKPTTGCGLVKLRYLKTTVAIRHVLARGGSAITGGMAGVDRLSQVHWL